MNFHLSARALSRSAAFAASPALAASLTACAGGGSYAIPAASIASPARTTTGSASVSLRFTFPTQASTAAAARRRDYVSPSVKSLAIVVNSGTPVIVNAPPVSASNTVTVTIPAPVGTDTFAFAEYDTNDAKGNVIASSTQNANVVRGQLNTLTFTLDGNLAKIAIALAAPSPFVEGDVTKGYTLVGNAAQQFVAVPQDADGNTIIAPGAIPAIAVSSATSAAVTVVDGANNQFGLYAAKPTTPIAITASGTDLAGKRVTASINVGATAAIYIANYLAQTINVYDEAGTKLALASNTFGGLTNPEGIAYVPAAVPGNPGSLVITETSNSSAPYVMQYDQNGVVQVLQNTSYVNTVQPLFLGNGPAGVLAVPNFQNSSVTLYDASGTQQSVAAGKFAGLASPVQIVYDDNNSNYYVTNLGSFKIDSFMADGTTLASAAAGSHPMGVAFDPNTKELYVADSGQVATASTSTAALAGITVLTEALGAVSTTGAFTNTSTSAAYVGIVFDPFDKQFYVTDAGNDTVVGFTEAGSAVTFPAGAFGMLDDPMSLVIVP